VGQGFENRKKCKIKKDVNLEQEIEEANEGLMFLYKFYKTMMPKIIICCLEKIKKYGHLIQL